jgi:hypothetical protein
MEGELGKTTWPRSPSLGQDCTNPSSCPSRRTRVLTGASWTTDVTANSETHGPLRDLLGLFFTVGGCLLHHWLRHAKSILHGHTMAMVARQDQCVHNSSSLQHNNELEAL